MYGNDYLTDLIKKGILMPEHQLVLPSMKSYEHELTQMGYSSVFDICSETKNKFIESIPNIESSQAKVIYSDAQKRAQQIKSLYRSWQLRKEPTISSLEKLSLPNEIEIQGKMKNIVYSESDFSDLLERSSEYTDAASIQSLFSPGRYAACLYAIATTLHQSGSDLHIDTRRPDLRELILSEKTMNEEVSSLDILLEVLSSEARDPYNFVGLSGSYSLNNDFWQETLVCTAYNTVCEVTYNSVNQTLTMKITNRGQAHYMCFYEANGAMIGYGATVELPVTIDYKNKRKIIISSINPSNNNTFTVASFEGVEVSSNGLEWTFFPMNLPYSDNLAQINQVLNIHNMSFNDAYKRLNGYSGFDVYNEILTNFDDIKSEKVLRTPVPVVREELKLTPNSYALMVNNNVTENDIINHYGLRNSSFSNVNDTTSIIAELSDVVTFCSKTSLNFEQLLELIGQHEFFGEYTEDSKYYISKDSIEPVKKYVYGSKFINVYRKDSTSSVVSVIDENTVYFSSDNGLMQLFAIEKLVRLNNKTQLSFEMLDWIIINAHVAVHYWNNLDSIDPTSTYLDGMILRSVAVCVDLQQRYGIDANTFVSFIGAVNPYATKDQTSFFESLFTSYDGKYTASVSSGKVGDNLVILCQALKVTEDELLRILDYCNLTTDSEWNYKIAGMIYRYSAIPAMFGISFSYAETIWKLMVNGSNEYLYSLSDESSYFAIELIYLTEQTLEWVNENELSLLQLQAMLSNEPSTTATAEMYTFLQNVYTSVGNIEFEDSGSINPESRQKIIHVMAGEFQQKNNLMEPITNWLSKNTDFNLENFWKKIDDLFKGNEATINDLQEDASLVKWSYQLSQRVLIVRWLNLNEQDLVLMLENPQWLDTRPTFSTLVEPSLNLLKVLTLFKSWQRRVVVSVDEALRLLPYLADDSTTAELAAEKIAAIHNLNADTVKAMNIQMLGTGNWPKNFFSLWTLLIWLKMAEELNIGATNIKDLFMIMKKNEQAEDEVLIESVAQSLVAGLNSAVTP